MGSTLEYIVSRFGLDLNRKSPIEILECNRPIMADVFRELGFILGVEVGVAKGEHAELLCKANPDLHLFCIDPWVGYQGYGDFKTGTLQEFYEIARARLKPYNCTIIRKFSMDAVGDFKDKLLDFVYIDGAHDFRNVADDICEWVKKVRPGGIVYGHDYKRAVGNYQNAVKDVVPSYCYQFKINPWFILGTQGKSDGLYREGTQSWMFVKS
jgi:SAM-dependent methyltransferase